jgi:serine/threonine protein kinase
VSQGGVDRQSATVKICLACNREFKEAGLNLCPHDGTSLIALKNEDEFLGKTLANTYYVTEKIGQGGMGVVYKANHQMLDRIVAIKMLQAELIADEMSVKRFNQEAKAASCLSHPHIITLFDFGVLPSGQPFLVMEYLEGVPLLDEIRQRGPIDVLRATKMFSEIADGLYHAHNQGIVHRDLKPSNIILVERDGDKDFVKIVDFGLAKLMPWSGKESQHLTKTGEVFGSPIYMSPEQCMGKMLAPTSDIYSLGITLFEAIVGKPPFRGTNSIQTASKHMSELPPKFSEMNSAISVSENLERVVMKTLQKQPEDRFQTMAEFKDALQAAVYNDQAIEIPASLLVSRHAVPALSSSASIPALKSSAGISAIRSSAAVPALRDQSETRLLTELNHGRDGGGSKGMIIAGAVAAGVLSLAGAGAWYFMSQQSNTLVEGRGNIWCYDKGGHYLQVHDPSKGPSTYELKIDDLDIVKDIPDNEDRSPVGLIATIEFKGHSQNSMDGTLSGVKLLKDPTPESQALNTVTDFVFKVSRRSEDEFENALKLTSGLSKDTIRKVFGTLVAKPDESEEIHAPRTRWASAERILSNDEGGIVIEVFKKAYDPSARPGDSWRFTVDPQKQSQGDKFTITKIENFEAS